MAGATMKPFDANNKEMRRVKTPDGEGTLVNFIIDEKGTITDWLVRFERIRQGIYKAEQLQEIEE